MRKGCLTTTTTTPPTQNYPDKWKFKQGHYYWQDFPSSHRPQNFTSFQSENSDRLCSNDLKRCILQLSWTREKLISRVQNTMLTNLTYLRYFKLVVSATFIVEVLLKVIGHESTQRCSTLTPFLIPFSFWRGATSTVYKYIIFFQYTLLIERAIFFKE